ncbi:MAG: urea amidolyase family protein [Castellaniella sp.]|nr:urea amidolyase family protein [Castellaniella sp.]
MAHPRILLAGDAALLAELGSLDAVLALFQVTRARRLAGVTDLVPAARTLLAQFEPSVVTPDAVSAWLRRCWQESRGRMHVLANAPAGAGLPARTIEIPVYYTGDDLDEVADRLGLSRAELIERHTAHDFQAAFAGFAPGFVYLTGGDACFHGLPRRPSPRTRVPAGSVAAAGEFSAVYPAESPGGWQLLGITPLRMWDLARAEPALVQPGFRVRFRDLGAPEVVVSLPAPCAVTARISAAAGSPGAVPGAFAAAVPHLEVLGAGLQTVFQDLGRPGLTGMGVSCSGALDRGALRRVNRLVGNRSDATVLENALGGLRLACHGRAVVAVTGAQVPVALTTASGVRLPAAGGRALTMEDGQVLRIGQPRAGVRCYVAVRGGWAVPPVLGSCATDVLAGIGPDPVRTGDRLVVGREAVAGDPIWQSKVDPESAHPHPRPGDVVTLDVVPGPRDDWFEPEALARLQSQEWLVTPQSNRVGMRLSGHEPLPRRRKRELPSEGTVTGAIQVPANGQPVLFLADHPLTGGYPVIAVVHSRELDRLGQVPVGARLRFRFVN